MIVMFCPETTICIISILLTIAGLRLLSVLYSMPCNSALHWIGQTHRYTVYSVAQHAHAYIPKRMHCPTVEQKHDMMYGPCTGVVESKRENELIVVSTSKFVRVLQVA